MNDDSIKNFINYDFQSLASYLKKLSPIEFSTLASLIGLILIPSLSTNEQNSVGNFLELIGQVLLTSGAQGQLLNPDLSQDDFDKFRKTYSEDLHFLLNLIKKQN